MISPKRLDEVTEKVSNTFWKEVTKQLPEFKLENLDHGTVIVLEWQMKSAIERYIQQNLEKKDASNP